MRGRRLAEFPTLAVLAFDVPLGIGSVGSSHLFYIPLDLLARAIRDIAEVVGFGQQTGVFEVAQCRIAPFAGDDPVLELAGRARDERVRPFEVGEFLFSDWAFLIFRQYCLVHVKPLMIHIAHFSFSIYQFLFHRNYTTTAVTAWHLDQE